MAGPVKGFLCLSAHLILHLSGRLVSQEAREGVDLGGDDYRKAAITNWDDILSEKLR